MLNNIKIPITITKCEYSRVIQNTEIGKSDYSMRNSICDHNNKNKRLRIVAKQQTEIMRKCAKKASFNQDHRYSIQWKFRNLFEAILCISHITENMKYSKISKSMYSYSIEGYGRCTNWEPQSWRMLI